MMGTIDRIKWRAEQAKDFAEKHKKGIIFGVKTTLLLGIGFYGGVKFSNKLDLAMFKKYMPDVIANFGNEGVRAYEDWLSDKVPDAMKVIDEFCDKGGNDDILPYFLDREVVRDAFSDLGSDPVKFYKDFRSIKK